MSQKLQKAQMTPGPWIIESNDASIVTPNTPEDGGDIICLAPDGDASYEHWRKANALAISAVPELIEAVVLMRAAMVYYQRKDRLPEDTCAADLYTYAVDALAKAGIE